MISRTASPTVLGTICAVLALLTGCGSGTTDQEPSPAKDRPSADGVHSPPTGSRESTPGKGSKNPDDINGDGHRDLLVPVSLGDDPDDPHSAKRVTVVYGSAKGLTPSTRKVYGRRDLGLPEPARGPAEKDSVTADSVITADLDSDGFPDFVTSVRMGSFVREGHISAVPSVSYVTWGGPEGPTAGAGATQVRLPQVASRLGVDSMVRGDFDGDGHHDLAARAQNQSSLVVLYGPFTRSGAPARTDTGLPWSNSSLVADDIDPSGKLRATALLLHATSDGEQSGNTLHPARRGTGLATSGRQLRSGNAHAFGDFDGDGLRDVAIGDDGSRNNEPGNETEAPEVDGSLAVYPGSGAAPVTYRLPEAPEDADSHFGSGGYVAADPDGDGRDGILVATYEGTTLIDGDKRTAVLREGPARANGKKTPAPQRHARPAGAADFDGDGKDELVLNWSADPVFGVYDKNPTHWWITDGTTPRDQTSFATPGFAPQAP